jgi:hypothetical protein
MKIPQKKEIKKASLKSFNKAKSLLKDLTVTQVLKYPKLR